MFNYPGIIFQESKFLEDIQFSSESLNELKSELIKLISEEKFNQKQFQKIMKKIFEFS